MSCNYYFRYRQKLNIKHTINNEEPHVHTLEVNLYFSNKGREFEIYDELEDVLEEYFVSYEGVLMNDIPAYKHVVPTIENIGYSFFYEISNLVANEGKELVKLEIGENPSRLFVVTDFLVSGSLTEKSMMSERHISKYIDSKYEEIVAAYNENQEKVKQEMARLEEEKPEPEVIEEEPEDVVGDNVSYQKVSSEILAKKKKKAKREKKERIFKNRCMTVIFIGVAVIVAAVFYAFALQRDILTGTGDIYLHLGKGDYLLTQLLNGRFSPMYMESWYDGYLMFMHCEPLSYYLLAAAGWLFGGNVAHGYIFCLGLIMFIGALGWIRLGKMNDKPEIGFAAGILWFFMPEMSRNYGITGDIKILLAVAFIPLLWCFISKYMKFSNKRSLIKISITMSLIVLSDLSVAIVVLCGVTAIYIYKIISERKPKHYAKFVMAMFVGIGLSMAWIYSAYVNGSIPDFIINREGFKVEVAVMGLLAVCLVLGYKNIKYYSFIGIIAGIISVYWVPQVVFIAYLALFAILIEWKECSKVFITIALFVVAVSGIYNYELNISYRVNTQNKAAHEDEMNIKNAVVEAETYTKGTLLYLDINDSSTFPAYYMTHMNKKIVFSNKSSAKYNMISDNVDQLKYALYTKNFNYVFDRSIELGCDTILVYLKDLRLTEREMKNLFFACEEFKYQCVVNNDRMDYMIFTRELPAEYGVNTEYKGLAIGSRAKSISILYPYFEEGVSNRLSDYSYEKLSAYDKIYLSAFEYDNVEEAEELVKKLADNGVEVYIDMDAIQADPLTNRQKFLDVTAQIVSFKDRFPKLNYLDSEIVAKEFYGEYSNWNTVYLENLDEVEGMTVVDDRILSFCGTKYNDNIHLLGFNILYHAVETYDESVNYILNGIFGLETGDCPKREIVEIKTEFDGTSIVVESDDYATISIAYQKNFMNNKNIGVVNNIVYVGEGNTVIEFDYTSVLTGIAITVVILIMVLIVNVILKKWRIRNEK